mmetsp:Transcript_50824/g.146651  ORF Transcript_50824/g.146651 Transcript_50824/m.146651 type:complete len:216 (-) Transcript_50824:1160-1807(-)
MRTCGKRFTAEGSAPLRLQKSGNRPQFTAPKRRGFWRSGAAEVPVAERVKSGGCQVSRCTAKDATSCLSFGASAIVPRNHKRLLLSKEPKKCLDSPSKVTFAPSSATEINRSISSPIAISFARPPPVMTNAMCTSPSAMPAPSVRNATLRSRRKPRKTAPSCNDSAPAAALSERARTPRSSSPVPSSAAARPNAIFICLQSSFCGRKKCTNHSRP